MGRKHVGGFDAFAGQGGFAIRPRCPCGQKIGQKITGSATGASPACYRLVTGGTVAEQWRNTGGTLARYRLAPTVTSDNTPADAAHEAGMAVRFLVGLLQANTDRDRDDVAR